MLNIIEMKIIVNNRPEMLPDSELTISEFIEMKGIKRGGTAISLNDNIVRQADWNNTYINDGDRVVIISAAFGG